MLDRPGNSFMNRIATTWRRRLCRGLLAVAGVFIVGWITESPRRPASFRPRSNDYISASTANMHRHGGGFTLDDHADGRAGFVRFTHTLQPCDTRWLATKVLEYRRLYVAIDGAPQTQDQIEAWRLSAAAYFADPAIMLGDCDDTHTLWFGYPGDVVQFFGNILNMLLDILWVLALRKHICPKCGYDIRGLPECRCPECGEQWRLGEVPRGLP